MDQWTPRVTARAELAELLLGAHLARAVARTSRPGRRAAG